MKSWLGREIDETFALRGIDGNVSGTERALDGGFRFVSPFSADAGGCGPIQGGSKIHNMTNTYVR
jgi:hypothetical protein